MLTCASDIRHDNPSPETAKKRAAAAPPGPERALFQRIYRKLGINTREELQELLDQ